MNISGALKAISCASALALVSSGCLTSAPPQPKSWVVSASRKQKAEVDLSKTAKLGAITVAAPYDRASLAVRRADGSVAFDAYNAFASSPAALLRTPLATLLGGSGCFGLVVPSSGTTVRTGTTIEAVIDDISLDCREQGSRVARVSLSLSVIENRSLVEILYGEGSADAASGDYSAAFSEAFEKAVSSAIASSASLSGRK